MFPSHIDVSASVSVSISSSPCALPTSSFSKINQHRESEREKESCVSWIFDYWGKCILSSTSHCAQKFQLDGRPKCEK